MKRKVIAIMMMVLMVAFTGCSGTQVDYWKAMQKVAAWEAAQTEQKGAVVVQLGPEQMKVNFQTKGHMNQKTLSGYMDLWMEVEVPASLSGTGKIEKQPFNMAMYMEGGKAYISKEYFVQAFTMTGQPVPEELAKLDAAYIGVEESNALAAEMMKLMGDQYQGEKLFKLYSEIGTLLGINIPVEQKDNTYTITLGKEQIVQLVKTIVDSGIQNLDAINTYLQLGLTKEAIAKIQEEYKAEKDMLIEVVDQYASLVEGAFVCKTTLEKEAQKDEVTFKVVPSQEAEQLASLMFGGKVSMEMTLEQSTTKAEPKAVAVPKVVVLSEEALSNLLGIPNNK